MFNDLYFFSLVLRNVSLEFQVSFIILQAKEGIFFTKHCFSSIVYRCHFIYFSFAIILKCIFHCVYCYLKYMQKNAYQAKKGKKSCIIISDGKQKRKTFFLLLHHTYILYILYTFIYSSFSCFTFDLFMRKKEILLLKQQHTHTGVLRFLLLLFYFCHCLQVKEQKLTSNKSRRSLNPEVEYKKRTFSSKIN